jgi:uncharacterized iron-regulated membrane protein
MSVRKVLFWFHLTCGVTAGVIILLMSVTGVLLMYERQMIAWADRGFRVAAPAGAQKLEIEALLEQLQAAEGSMPASLVVYSNPSVPAEALFGRRTVYVDPYQGHILGEGSAGIRAFFRTVTDWHRWLAMSGDGRNVGRTITGVCNLAFLFLVMTGMYIWLPRRWSWPQFRAVLLFRGGLAGKARDFNWHNVIGIWCAVPLFFVVLGGVMISFPWATNLLYRVTGSEPPPAARPAAPAGGSAPARAVSLRGLDRAWGVAQRQVEGWQTVTIRVPASERAPFSFLIAESHRGRPDKRSTLTVDRQTGAVRDHETFASYNTGRRWRMWLRFIHTGEALGVAGQTIAGVVSAGGAVLVWTGIALCWRRFRNWRSRRGSAVVEHETEAALKLG